MTATPLAEGDARDWAVRDYKRNLKTVERWKPASVNLALAALDSSYTQLGLGRPVVRQEDPPATAPRAITVEEQRRLLRMAERSTARDGAIVVVLLYTGLRLAELVALEPAWTAARAEICAGLSLDPVPEPALEQLGAQPDGAYRQTDERLDDNLALEIAEIDGNDRPDPAKLEALDQPEQLTAVRATTTGMLPDRVAFSGSAPGGLPLDRFRRRVHPPQRRPRARVKDLHISVCAVLLAEACNISLTDVAHPSVAARSYNRLSWVSQNYVRAETIAAANDLLLSVYRSISLVQSLGDGHITTVDGMRFQVPVGSIHTGPNPRYFARGRGVTWLNYMSDQFTGLHAIVVPGTLRVSLMILDGLLELQPPDDGGPTIIITDQASYSDQLFGLFWLLGYQFSPRPAGLSDEWFWRLERHADYGPLDRLARHRIHIELIIEQWEDILRVAGSLSTGTVRASELMRVLLGGRHLSRLRRAIAELGRVAKTLHLLSWIDSEEQRR